MLHRFLASSIVVAFCTFPAFCQNLQPSSLTSQSGAPTATDTSTPSEDKRIFGIIPNYRSYSCYQTYAPLTASEKFKIASEDAFDRGTFALGILFGAESQLTNANRDFGQGAAGFGKYVGAAYGDLMIGDYMTEAVFPSLLHQDPRYFRRGTGSGWSRLGWAVGQIFRTRSDSGKMQFNYSEVVGNSAAVAISNAYYRDHRNAGDALSKLGVQIGVDTVGNILKEFWPDIERKFRHKPQPGQ